MKYFGIPDIQSKLARDNYPSDLSNFQPRIAQAIIRNRCDKIFASESQKPNFETLQNFYQELGVDELIVYPEQIHYVETQKKEFLAEAILYTHTPKELKSLLNGYQLTPYNDTYHTSEISKISHTPIFRNDLGARFINNKSLAQRDLRDLGVSTPEGKSIFHKNEGISFFKHLQSQGYKQVSFKLNNSINGMGVFKADNLEDFTELLDTFSEHYLDETGKYAGVLIDGWIEDIISSPNIQYYVGKTPDEDRFISCSEQILVDGGTEHIGNISDESILEKTPGLKKDLDIVLNWIRDIGGYGVVGIDFIITKDSAYFIEINCRYNGSTHAPIIADKLGIEQWGTHDGILLPGKDFGGFISQLERDNILYKDGEGILPVNPATVHLGKTMIVALGKTKEQIQELISHVTSYE